MHIDTLIERIHRNADREAVILDERVIYYRDLADMIERWKCELEKNGIGPGEVVALTGDYSPEAVSLIIALIRNLNIITPLSSVAEDHFDDFFEIAHTQWVIELQNKDVTITRRESDPRQHDLLRQLIDRQHPGLILFTSGTTGQPKAVTHDFDKLLSKFIAADKRFRTLCFLMFDHIAGIDTYFYCLYSGSTAIFPTSRNAGYICGLIEKHHAEVLPTSPTFLNLLLLSEEYRNRDLSSLKIITFGSEKIPEHLLNRIEQTFPGVKLIQKYGLTELGSPPSKSKKGDAAWIKIDSDVFKTRVVDGMLYVKADTAMLGYLNAPSPFTEDGWFITGDSVEVDGEYMKIHGRKSEIINIGGEKVYPTEVESVIHAMDNIADVTVFGEPNPIMGQIVCAKIRLVQDEDPKSFTVRLKKYCRDKLENYKVPIKINIEKKDLHTTRFKKNRQG